MENQKKDNYKEDENYQKPNNENNINQNDLYLEQVNKIINSYKERNNRIKSCFEVMYKRYQQSQEFYELFINLIKDYKEIKLNNIDNLTNLLNKYFPEEKINNKTDNNQIYTIKSEFKEIIKIQIEAEKDKINQLNLVDINKNLEDKINKSQKLLDNLNNLYNSYINSINEIEKKHLKYLKYFNDYEMKLIDSAEQKNKNKDINSTNSSSENINIDININNEKNKNNNNIIDSIFNENEQNEFNEMSKKLLKKEKKYKKLLRLYDENIHPSYVEFKKCIDDLSVYHNDFNEQENQLFTFIYLGFIIGIESQHIYQKKELNFQNLTNINYQNYKELNQLFESINFENYKAVLLYPNKDDYHSCKELPPEIVIKLTNYINSYFSYITKMEIGDYEEPNQKIINDIIKKIFADDIVSENEENIINNVLKKNEYRLQFLKSLNNYRSKGKFILSNKNLIVLGNIITRIVDLYDKNNKDYDIFNLLIIMSQTYYTISQRKEKVYLLRFIEDHELFQSEELWSFYIDESINREINGKEKKLLEELNLDEDAKNERINNIYFTVLLSVTQNILEFQIDKLTVMKIMSYMIDKKYKIMPVYIEQIFSLIDETVYEKRTKFNPYKEICEK